MDSRSKYTSVLVAYYAGVANDLPSISPYARDLARLPPSVAVAESALAQACLTDPYLCGKLCGVANSIFYNYDHRDVYTLKECLARVGVKYARGLLNESPVLSPDIDEAQIGVFWAHCMAVAVAARRVASLAADAPFHEDVAYLVGMIHDIGYLLEIHYSPQRVPAVLRSLASAETEVDGESRLHALNGRELARYWALPRAAVDAIGCHHAADICGDEKGRWLSRVISLGESLVVPPISGGQAPAVHSIADSAGEVAEELALPLTALDGIRREAARVHEECIRIVSGERPDNTPKPPLRTFAVVK